MPYDAPEQDHIWIIPEGSRPDLYFHIDAGSNLTDITDTPLPEGLCLRVERCIMWGGCKMPCDHELKTKAGHPFVYNLEITVPMTLQGGFDFSSSRFLLTSLALNDTLNDWLTRKAQLEPLNWCDAVSQRRLYEIEE